RRIVELCEATGLRFKVLPGIAEVLAGDIRINQLREMRIEDLLGREPVLLKLPELAADLSDRSVLITGAAGSIGAELARQVALHGPGTLVLFDQAETDLFYLELELREKHPELRLVPVVGDVVDADLVESVFAEYRPERVYHAAAYKHVPMMEMNPRAAVRNNVLGTWRVAEAAGRHRAEKFVLVSTDKAVRPVSVMGATKRVAELIVLELQQRHAATAYAAVRFGNVLGSNGSVIPVFKRQLEAGQPLTVTHQDVTRYFMTIQEAVQLILQASLVKEVRGRIAMLEMGDPVRIADLAANLLRLSGARPGQGPGIVFTGLRPGERLHEELVAPHEETIETHIPKVRIIRNSTAGDRPILPLFEDRGSAPGDDRDAWVVAALSEYCLGVEKAGSQSS
ncbi:MAG: polysaccharide biosynthesis protein, partial [Gemmatimonadetes bacterium]|nr:polysaccharide biosynthesis protein [Gemmatimonadota bacterium]